MQNAIARCSLAASFTMIVAVSVFAAPATQPSAATQGGGASNDGGKLLVLPFHEAVAADYRWVGKAMQQDLVVDLTRGTRTQVEGPSAAPPAEDAAGALTAAKQAGATMVVYGQFQAVGGQIRITGQVLSVQTAQPLGNISATGPLNDLFPLEDAVSVQVIRALPSSLVTIPPAAASASAAPPIGPIANAAPAVDASVATQPLAASQSDQAASSSRYYSYTYPDYSSGPPSLYPATYLDSPYRYGYPYYWYTVPYYGPDIFFYYGWDHYHHHLHNWGPANHWHEGGLHDIGRGSHFGAAAMTHAPAGRSLGAARGGGGGGFHGGGGAHH